MDAIEQERSRALHAFLACHVSLAEESARWAEGRVSLRVRTYLGGECPPLEFITSVRCLVFHGDRVLVMRNLDSTHIVPGGRREAGETLQETLRRELLEETGWTVAGPRLLGFNHFHNQEPQLPEFRQYPYPDFVQVVFMADADCCMVPDTALADDYEVEATFRSVAEVHQLALTPGERVFLAAAVHHRTEANTL
jgi:ADP-ribose pyrophosphatase YjhB (NUDIX family)